MHTGMTVMRNADVVVVLLVGVGWVPGQSLHAECWDANQHRDLGAWAVTV